MACSLNSTRLTYSTYVLIFTQSSRMMRAASALHAGRRTQDAGRRTQDAGHQTSQWPTDNDEFIEMRTMNDER